MTTFSLNTFTNPNGARVSQVFAGAVPITRELDDPQRARDAAWDAYNRCYGSARLMAWDGDTGDDPHELAHKP